MKAADRVPSSAAQQHSPNRDAIYNDNKAAFARLYPINGLRNLRVRAVPAEGPG